MRKASNVAALLAVALVLTGVVAQLDAQAQKPHADGSSPAAGRSSSKASGVIVNLNTASVADLEQLPGIGAKTAARIIEYRQKKGAFKKIEELMNVQGIGEKSFLKLKPQITVGANAASGQTR
jgi:competence protein ComEA